MLQRIQNLNKNNSFFLFGARGTGKTALLKTKDNAEIDLIVQRPGNIELLVEIKSARRVTGEHISQIRRFKKDWQLPCDAEIWSLDPKT